MKSQMKRPFLMNMQLSSDGVEVAVEFFLPDELHTQPEVRAQISHNIQDLLSQEVHTGERGRLLYDHNPAARERRYILSVLVPAIGQSEAHKHSIGCETQRRLVAGMVSRGFAARGLEQDEYVELQTSFPTPGKGINVISLECAPETTHPQITGALQGILQNDRYLYFLDFERQEGADEVTASGACLFSLSLVLSAVELSTVQEVQRALFQMDGALGVVLSKGRSLRHLSALRPFSGQQQGSFSGSTYTIADLIPA